MNDLAVQSDDLPALFELAKQLVPTGFLPDHVKTPGQAVAIILAGRELGMPPMRALRSLTMVKGKVVESADSQLGRFKAAGGKATFLRLEDTGCELKLTHPNGDEHLETFTINDAKRAGLTANQTWSKYPKAMLRSRAITAGLKSVGWDGAVGNYDPEEAREIGPVAAPAPTIQMPRRLSERRDADVAVVPDHHVSDRIPDGSDSAGLPAPEVITELDLEPDLEAQLSDSIQAITLPQQKKLFATLNDSAHTELDFRAWLVGTMGLDSTKAIPKSKLDAVLRRLEDDRPLHHDYKAQWRRRR